ncbi:MAG: hypothetical protein Q7S40_03335 [Opitutaceae bacterium]|nr:hypothetical protein [Opitutaceae bacterium]
MRLKSFVAAAGLMMVLAVAHCRAAADAAARLLESNVCRWIARQR